MVDRGDGNDLFCMDGAADEISDSGSYKDGQLVSSHANLRWYQDGAVEDSGIRIFDIGYSGHTVSFKLVIPGQGGAGAEINDFANADGAEVIAGGSDPATADPTIAPTAAPTTAPTAAPIEAVKAADVRTVDTSEDASCKNSGEPCERSDECCSLCSCKRDKKSKEHFCKLRKKSRTDPVVRASREKKKKNNKKKAAAGARKLREKRRITPLA